MLEGWAYANEAHKISNSSVFFGTAQPFPGRLDLERRAFERGDPKALAALWERYGVTYLVVNRANGQVRDKAHGRVSVRLLRFSSEVYSNPALSVYRLDTKKLARVAQD